MVIVLLLHVQNLPTAHQVISKTSSSETPQVCSVRPRHCGTQRCGVPQRQWGRHTCGTEHQPGAAAPVRKVVLKHSHFQCSVMRDVILSPPWSPVPAGPRGLGAQACSATAWEGQERLPRLSQRLRAARCRPGARRGRAERASPRGGVAVPSRAIGRAQAAGAAPCHGTGRAGVAPIREGAAGPGRAEGRGRAAPAHLPAGRGGRRHLRAALWAAAGRGRETRSELSRARLEWALGARTHSTPPESRNRFKKIPLRSTSPAYG